MDPSADQADKELAQLLHAAGRLPLEQLQRALEQTRAQRGRDPSASLARLLTGSGVIQTGELQRLVASSGSHSTLIRPVVGGDTVVDSLSGSEAAGRERWRVGRRIGHYELIELLGRGGMGVVFRARHVGTGQAAAIKGLLIDDEESVERFAREALAQSSVDTHPNVAAVYESGQADGKAFLVMELVEGGDLETRLKERGRLSGAEAAPIVAALARGLDHVHQAGILHRDLKPANVLFSSEGAPKLVDFGMARLDRAQRLTQTGQIVGTPAYMAPEQAMGVERVDARADVYGLGAVLYTALTGEVPFQGNTAMEVLSKVISEEPTSARVLAPDLDPDLEAICKRAMAKEPQARYQSAAALAEALEGWSPRAAGGGGRTWGALAAGLVLGVALGAGVVLALGPKESVAPEAALAAQSPAVTPAPTAAATTPPEAEPEPAPSEAPLAAPSRSPQAKRAAPIPRIPIAELRRGTTVLVEIKHPDFPDQQTAQLGWIASRSEGDLPQVSFLVAGGHVLGPVEAPPSGFRRDAFGAGAKVAIRDEEHLAEVVTRRGPMALVERQDLTREWMQVSSLTLIGVGVDASAAEGHELFLAPWSQNESLYPSLVVSRGEAGLVRIVYLESDGAWVSNSALRPLPKVGESLTFGKSDEQEISGRVLSYPHPWLVEIAPHSDPEKPILAEMLWVYVRKRDRK